MGGILYVVSTPIGHVDDLTLRAVRVFKNAAVVAAEDPQQTKVLFDHHAIETPITSYHNANKETKAAVLIAYLQAGHSVALVADAGTPVVADPGRYLVEQAIAAKIPVSPVPGPSAVLAAVAVSGLSGDSFIFAGMLPKGPQAARRFLLALKAEPRTLVLLVESPARLRRILALLKNVLGDRHMILAKALTTEKEECIRGTASHLLATVGQRQCTEAVTIVIEGREKTRTARAGRKIRRPGASGS